ncbi:MAG: hypothetical protein ACTSYU_05775 [Promethearchaeota archaeon]
MSLSNLINMPEIENLVRKVLREEIQSTESKILKTMAYLEKRFNSLEKKFQDTLKYLAETQTQGA